MENFRGAGWMVLAMLGFALCDMMIKLMSGAMPAGQILMMLGAGGAIVFAVAVRLAGQPLWTKGFLGGAVILRNVGEIVGTVGFMLAIVLTPISQASAILQASPLMVTLGAAVLLGEQVGWRRWSAIFVGFLGVLLVIGPGSEGFDAKAIITVIGVIGLSLRDLITRRVQGEVSSLQLSFLGFLMLVPSGAIMLAIGDAEMLAPTARQWGMTGLAVFLGCAGYYAIVAAMRIGEVSFVTPFRYTRIVFALIVGAVVFGERPDAMMLLGAAIIVGSGIYTVWRERKHRPAA